MQKIIKNTLFFSALAVIIATLGCPDLQPVNPYDPDNPDYIKTQITIIIEYTEPDSLFYTDSPVKIGINAKSVEVMDRIQKILINFGVGDPVTKIKPVSHPFLDIWCDSTHIYPTVGKKTIGVKVVTINNDDILDSTEITINGRGAYIATHPQLFADPFEEKDSLYLSVDGGGTAPLAYQWYKDSVSISNQKLKYLIIPSLSLEDSGNYYCEVSNTYGSDTSNKSFIRVMPETADTSWPSVFFSIAASQGPESNNASIQVNLSKPFAKDNVIVRLGVNAASSAGVNDYSFTDTTLSFQPNEVVKSVAITVVKDSVNEDNETVVLDLKSAKNGVLIADSIVSHTYTIVDDDDARVQFSSSSFSITEKDTGFVCDSIAVILTGLNDKPATIDYAINADSTTATGSGIDYTLLGSGKLTFPALSKTAWVKLNIYGDTLSEKNEVVFLRLLNPAGGISLSTANTTCRYTIIENDRVVISFDQGQTLTVPENGAQIDLAVSISKKCDVPVTCAYKVTGGSASGAGVDYTLPGNGSLTFDPGSVRKQISLSIVDDTTPETDETINLEIYSPSANASIGDLDSLTLTILDNEKPVAFFKEPSLSGLESVTSVNIPVSLSFSPQKQVTVSYSINQSSTAAKDKDYTLVASTLVFSIGDTVTKNINVTVTDDQINEFDETIIIDLTTVENGTLHATKTRHTYTITDNDQSNCGFSELTYTLLEKNSGAEKDSIEVVLSGVNDIETSVEYKIVPGSSTATGGGVDYTLYGTGKLTFPANTLKQYIILDVVGDTLSEGDENIQFALFNPVGGISLAGQDTVCNYVIRDNDVVTISFDGSQPTTIDESGLSLSLVVVLSKVAQEKVTVGYSVTGGTAQGAGIDFTLGGTGVLEFAPGDLQKTIPISIVDDASPEPEETVILELHTPSSNAILGTIKNFTLTILDNEKPVVSFQETAVNKYESETTVNIPVVLSFAPQKQVSVPFSVLTTSTASSADYSLSATPLVFDAGSVTTKNIVLSVVNDKEDESDETVIIELGVPTNATIGTAKTYTYTINDDEYTIIMAKTGEGTTVPSANTVVSRGENLSIISRPSLYWHFDTWTGTAALTFEHAADTATRVMNITTAGTVTANFGRDTHTVTVSAGTGGTVTPAGNNKVANGGSLDISATANQHYNFVNWTSSNLTIEAPGSAATRVTTVTVVGTVTANFAPVQYYVTINKDGNGSGTLNQASQNVPYNSTITITASPTIPGSNFGGWTFTPSNIVPVDGNANDPTEEFRVLGAGTITATFNKNNYTVNLTTNGADSGAVVTSSPQYVDHGNTVSIHARAKKGCKFKNWSANPTGNISFAVASDSITNATVTGAATIIANFETIGAVSGVVYVDSAANGAGARDGTSWFNAYVSLAKAMSGKPAGTIYWVAKGTYTPIDEIGGTNSTRFEVLAGDTIYGGFEGNEVSRIIKRDTTWMRNPTILSGSIPGGGNSTRIARMNDNSHINGVILSKGQIGVTKIGRNSSLKNCIFKENTNQAVVIATNARFSTVDNCVFQNNIANGGSAIFISGDTSLIQNCVFTGNIATTSSGSCVYVSGNTRVFIVMCAFVDNKSETSGQPAVLVVSARTRIIGSVFYNNVAGNGSGFNELINTSAVLPDTSIIEDCYIQDTDGHAILGTHKKVGNTYVNISFTHAFNDIGSAVGGDGIFFTADDGFCIGASSVLIGKTSGKTLVLGLPMSNRDILGKTRPFNAYDVGAYQH